VGRGSTGKAAVHGAGEEAGERSRERESADGGGADLGINGGGCKKEGRTERMSVRVRVCWRVLGFYSRGPVSFTRARLSHAGWSLSVPI
jgi:hypothetical protein